MPSRILAAVMTLAIVFSASPAFADEPAPELITSAVTVPVFGTSLVITVVADDTGEFVSAEVSAAEPTDAAAVAAADGFTAVVDDEHGGFEVNLVNDVLRAKIEIEVGADGTITETEVEGYDPGAVAGSGVWTGTPIAGLGSVSVLYTVTIDAAGCPAITIDNVTGHDPGVLGVDLTIPTDEFNEADEGECGLRHTVGFYNADWVDTELVQMDLVFEIEVERGESELEITLVDPNAKGDHDEDHDSDHDDDHDDDHGDDDDDDDDQDDEGDD